MDTPTDPILRTVLLELIDGETLTYQQKGTSYQRIVATCYLRGQDIAAMMIQRVQARDCPRYSGGVYAGLEDARHAALPRGTFCER